MTPMNTTTTTIARFAARITARTMPTVGRITARVERTAATVAWRAFRPVPTCAVCGGRNVRSMQWLNHGAGHVVEPETPFEGGDNNWCDDCADHVDLTGGWRS